MKHGSGIYRKASGVKYEGQWKNGNKHGTGRVLSPEGKIVQEGLWDNDRFTGK